MPKLIPGATGVLCARRRDRLQGVGVGAEGAAVGEVCFTPP